MSFGARADIRFDALKANFDLLKSRVDGCRVMAAVKANAYGHGLVAVANALQDADAFAVARLVEAEALRRAGINNSIVLMGGVISDSELRRASALSCDLVVHSQQQIDLLFRANLPAMKTWLKIDTGMHRLGISLDEAPGSIEKLHSASSVRSLGLMTHFANSDDLGDSMTDVQIERFATVADGFDGDTSIANSAALLGWRNDIQPDRHWASRGDNWVRPGISLYGISPLNDRSADELGLESVMDFDTCLIAVKPLKAFEPVGYGGTWASPHDTVIGIAAAGYGDGYSRYIPSGAPLLVNGRRAALAGVVSMDLLCVDLGPDSTDKVGDKVRLWGQGLPVEDVAAHAGLTTYSLVTGVRDREQ